MDKSWLIDTLNLIAEGKLAPDLALEAIMQQRSKSSIDSGDLEENRRSLLKTYLDLGYAKVDLTRRERNGFAEVIFGEGKTVEQIVNIAKSLIAGDNNVLVTRITPQVAVKVTEQLPYLIYDQPSQCLFFYQYSPPKIGKLAVVTAGTADFKVAAEVVKVGEFLGLEITEFYDVGVAGLDRLLANLTAIKQADVVVCVAGMEGALVSVLGGLIDVPILAVPSGIGYGAGADGIATLLAMLNTCASGVAVMNIGNGFGAAYMAATICYKFYRKSLT